MIIPHRKRTLFASVMIMLLCCFYSSVSAQTKPDNVLKGQVNDLDGNPVIGASVQATNITTNFTAGAKTDSLGVFRFLNLPEGGPYFLAISSVGFETQTMSGYMVKRGADISVLAKLKTKSADIDEFVVVGYGAQKKVNLSGAVQSVSGDVLKNRPINNINSGLQGMVANLNIVAGSGQATDAPSFNIRGITSISGSSSPLILIDNVPVTADELSQLNPADIENVSVLKDAGAAAIYGARAAFGVVLITTKTAKSNKLQIAANFNYGIRKNMDPPKVITDPLTIMQYKRDAGAPLYNLYPDAEQAYAKRLREDPTLPRVFQNPGSRFWSYYGSTDWISEVFNEYAPSYTGDVSIAKKDEKMSYFLSAGYYRQEGSLKYGNDIMNRYNLRAKTNFNITPWLQVGNNTAFTHRTYEMPTFLNGYLFWNVNRTASLTVPKNPDGTWTNAGAGLLGALQEGGRTSHNIADFLTTFNTQITLLKNTWTLNGDATFRRTNEDKSAYNLPVYYRTGPEEPLQALMPQSPVAISTSSYASNTATQMKQQVFNIYTDFHKTFNRKHYLQALVGFNQEYRYFHDFTSTRLGLITPNLPSPQLATGIIQPPTDFIADYALRGFFYRLNYIFDNKYILELNARSDGTSRFPSDRRWGFFPSASASWVVSKEKFFEPLGDAAKMSLLKFRASYGTLGNQVLSDNLRVSAYPYFATMPARQLNYILDGTRPPSVGMPGFILPDQTWEKATSLNLGADMAFFNNKLELGFDWYNRRTMGMLVKSKSLPGVFGTSEPRANFADLTTKGWELTMAWKDVFTVGGKPLQVGARFVLSNSLSQITRYDNPSGILTDYYTGQTIGEIWGLQSDGFFQSDDELKALDQSAVGTTNQQFKFYVGDIRFRDLNGDKKINFGQNTLSDPGDQQVIGNNRPQYPYSLDLNSSWRGFDVRLFFQGIGKRDWYPTASNIYYWGVYAQPWSNVLQNNTDHWTPENRNAYYPRVKSYIAERAGQELAIPQTKYMEDASYLRLKNITIGYTLPASLLKRWKVSNIRFYLSGENLLTYKKLRSNMDPEAISFNSGAGAVLYPFQKAYSCGLNLNF